MLVVIRCRLITGVANKSLLDVEVHIVPCVPQSPSGGGGGDDGQEDDTPVDVEDAPPAEPEEEPVSCRNCGCGKLSETNEDGITTTRYDAAAQPMASVQKQLISQFSGTIESKSVFVSERGLTSTQWTEYSEHTKRVQYSTVPTSSITAEVVMVDGFALAQKDTAGGATTFTRSYTVNGMVLTQTDGRGNTTTTVADKAGRALMVTDAAGNVTTTVYCDCCDQPATITDAQGNTTCYRYDLRGRKVAEWGTGI